MNVSGGYGCGGACGSRDGDGVVVVMVVVTFLYVYDELMLLLILLFWLVGLGELSRGWGLVMEF